MSVAENQAPLIDHENDPLNHGQINYALELISQRHGLLEAPIEVTWPFLKWMCCCFLKKRKRSFKLGLKIALRKKLALKMKRAEYEIEANPFIKLGYGMSSYFKITLQMMWMCVFISMVAIPLMMVYQSGGGITTGYAAQSLGALQGSDSFCSQAPIAFDNTVLSITCPTNTYVDFSASGQDDTKIYSYGVFSSQSTTKNWCSTQAIIKAEEDLK